MNVRKFLFLTFVLLGLWACSKTEDEPTVTPPEKTGVIHLSDKTAFNSYYSSLDNTNSADLKANLHNLIKGNKVLPYTSSNTMDVWNALERTDEDPDNSNNVILIYTGRSQSKSSKDRGGNDGDAWNREHIWAKSRGFGGDPYSVKGPATDIHHIRPVDRSVNTARSNKYFDEGGQSHSEAIDCKFDSDSWEPRDEVKGDIARMLFYMVVRYEGDDGYKDLELNDRVPGDYTLPNMGMLTILKKWNEQDKPDAFEKRRNQIIFEIQGNRNPFIDHPEFVKYIW